MPVKRAKSKAARMAAHAAMVCGAMAITTIAARFMHSAQDARPAFGERQAYAQILSRGQRLFENWNGLGDQTTEKNSVEIVVPADVGTERFVGEIGSRDEADFRSQDGSGNMMRVTSLDDDLKTLIAVRVQGKSEVGTAYSLRRQDDGGLIGGRGLYELKWSARGMDSAVAIDVDTYLESHGGSVSQAMRASQRKAGARDVSFQELGD